MKKLYLDFEFNRVTHEFVNLVSCVTYDFENKEIKKWWLHSDKKEQAKLRAYIEQFDLIEGYAAVAEARCFISLGLDPLDFKWIDQFIEYRCLTNHNDKLQWGKQLVDGRVKHFQKPKPKWERTEDDIAAGFSPTHSLAEATYKLLGVIRDTEHKTKMRDLIIADHDIYTPEERDAILDYGVDDIKDLPAISAEIIKNFKLLLGSKFNREELEKEQMTRGRYSAHTAWMESRGYPIDYEKTKNFSNQVGNIVFDMQREISGLFPDIKPFSWDKKNGRYKMNQANIRVWIKRQVQLKKWQWMKTDTGMESLSLEAFEKYFDFKHDYPTDNFGAQMVRFLKLKQSIFGFAISKSPGKRTFWDNVGPDQKARPYMNIFKAQSSRSQPASTGFMFLKPAWMRALVQHKEGRAIGGVDYSSEEFLISAIEAGDKNMFDAYKTGDVYLAFAKQSGQVPQNATKESHKSQRNAAKSSVLGISFLMTKYGLAIKLTADTGREWDEDEAQEMIDAFYDTYDRLGDYQEEIIEKYVKDKFLRLDDGWLMFGDNPNFRSIANCRIQGMGACIMRKAVDLCHERGLEVLFTLHDALYIQYKVGEEHKMEILQECMRDAFVYYWPKDKKEWAKHIRLDPFAWSRNYKPNTKIKLKTMELEVSNLYVDDRSINDYEKFSKYFDARAEDLL